MSTTVWVPRVGDSVRTPDGQGEVIGKASCDRNALDDLDYVWGQQRVAGPYVVQLETRTGSVTGAREIRGYRLDDLGRVQL